MIQPKALLADTAWQRLLSRDSTLLVESVFRHTLNLVSEQTGERYTLFLENGYSAPRAMTVTALGSVKPGDTMQIANGAIQLSAVTVNMQHCEFRGNGIAQQGAPKSSQIVALQQWLAAYAVEGSFFEPAANDAVSQATVKRLATARNFFARMMREEGGIEVATKGLIGLGIGLTPSGDDYLVGWLAIIRSTRMFGEQGSLELELAIREQLHRTTAVSRLYLEEALLGQFAEPIRAVCSAVSSGNDRQVEEAAQVLFEHGATSGQDVIVGMIDALSMYKHKEMNNEI